MTALGKILIFLNLVFALLMGILVIQVYATRTSWRAAHERVSSFLTVSEANVKTLRADIDDVKKKKDDEIKAVQGDLDKEKKEVARQQGLVAQADKQLQAERANHQQQRDNAGVSNAELERRQQETRALTAELNKSNATIAFTPDLATIFWIGDTLNNDHVMVGGSDAEETILPALHNFVEQDLTGVPLDRWYSQPSDVVNGGNHAWFLADQRDVSKLPGDTASPSPSPAGSAVPPNPGVAPEMLKESSWIRTPRPAW